MGWFDSRKKKTEQYRIDYEAGAAMAKRHLQGIDAVLRGEKINLGEQVEEILSNKYTTAMEDGYVDTMDNEIVAMKSRAKKVTPTADLPPITTRKDGFHDQH